MAARRIAPNIAKLPELLRKPWSAELQPNYYVVRDANKQQLAYVYFENEPLRVVDKVWDEGDG
jgi:hypothetical protein